ncbi:MAG: type IX secretion system protein PorQ [Sphingomonadales bacterium]|nr:type IX secretion system protein PorQ [Sphingomonadales bacterium]
MQKRAWFFGLAMGILSLNAQTGGTGVFRILDVPLHSRALAWSGYLVTQPHADVLQSVSNPALLNESHVGKFGLSAGSVLPTVMTANATGAWKGKRLMWSGFAQLIDAGAMDAYDAGGNPQGEVKANETQIGVSTSCQLEPRLRVGAQLGMVYSVLGPYVSNGVFMNLGCNYIQPDSVLSWGLLVKNLGAQIITYRDAAREPLPLNIQMGVSLSPKHMPLKFHITAHSLQRWDLTYDQYIDNGGKIDLNGKPVVPSEAGFAAKLMRHMAIGTELALGQNLSFLIGYSHQRRMEMSTSERRGTSGFGWGMKFKMAKLDITYGSASYFPGQNSNQFSLSIDPTRFSKKRTIANVAERGVPEF